MEEILTPEQWYELKGRIRQLHPELTDNDLQYHEATERDIMSMVEFSIRKANEVIYGAFTRRFRQFPLKYYWRYTRHKRLAKREK